MKFQKYGKELPNALELEGEIQPIDFAMNSSFKRLNYLLKIIRNKKPNIFSDYIKNLELKYKSLVKEDILSKKVLDITEFLKDFEYLKEYPKLAKYNLEYFLQILQLSDKDDWIKEKTNVVEKNYLRAFLIPRYYNVLVLTETIKRDEAIKLYKYFVSQNIKDNLSPNRKIFDTLEDFQEYFEMDKKEITIGWHGVLSDVKDGKYFFRKDNCLWADALIDLPDKMLKYLICCYGDFQIAVARSNDNFILTMKHTIVEGDPYCDCIIHDTSIDWNLTHPPKEYWDAIVPLDEN